MRNVFVSAVLLSLGSVACAAQPAPTTDSMIDSLTRPSTSAPGRTRGLAPLPPAAGGGSAGAVSPGASAGRPAARPSAPSLSLHVEFASGSDGLLPAAMRTLDRLGQALTSPKLASDRFRIEGHTDTVGPDDMNKELSERRARAVAQYLSDKFQIPASRLEIAGLGKDGLAVETADGVAEARNRRVQVVNLGA